MIDYRGRLIAKLSTDPSSPDMGSVVLASSMTVDITDNENFAVALDYHVKVDMFTVVDTARLTMLQLKLAVDSDTLA